MLFMVYNYDSDIMRKYLYDYFSLFQELDIEVLDITTLKIINNTSYRYNDGQQNIIFVGKQSLHLFF